MWTIADIPAQAGKRILITGATSGLGLEATRVLRAKGATVIAAGRNPEHADGDTLRIELADLASVRAAAAEVRERYGRLDVLINNAGVMRPPYTLTKDGFELQFGVNHLAHFLLTELLADHVERVVTVSSVGHKLGDLGYDPAAGYDWARAYGKSKLANLLFAFELGRRRPGLISVAAHPGAARTALMRHSPWHFRFVADRRTRLLFSWLIQSAEAGTLPILRAATDPAAKSGDYYGPAGWGQFTGAPELVRARANAYDEAAAAELWETSARLTGMLSGRP